MQTERAPRSRADSLDLRPRWIWLKAPALLVFLATPVGAVIRPGDSLAQCLRDFQSRGMTLIWSSQLVRDDLVVPSAPRGDTMEQQLRSLLEPLGLDLQPLGGRGWVVVERSGAGARVPEAPTPVRALDTIVVQTSRYQFDRISTDALSLSRVQIEELPGTEEDVARSLQSLPGTAAGDYSARTHVRGSRDDETVFRFDGVTLYDPFHLKNFQGLFSAIDPAAIESVRFWTGDFPIELGGSIGAVAEIAPRQPTRLLAEAGLSVLNTSLLLGSPFADGRGSVLVSARNSNLSYMAQLFDRNIGDPDFRDIIMRVTWDINDRVHLSAGALGLKDAVSLSMQDPVQQAFASYQDHYIWTRLSYPLGGDLRGETLVSDAGLRARRSAAVDRPGINQGSLQESRDSSVFTLRQDLHAAISPRLSLRGGAEFTHASTLADIDSLASFDAPFFPGVQPVQNVRQDLDVPARYHTLAAHVAVRWEARNTDVLEAGIRRDSQHFQDENERSQWNVRVNWWHRFSDDLTVRAAWGQYAQPQILSRLDVADGLSELDSARRARQTSLSLEKRFGRNWLLRLGAYDKHESSSRTSFENLFSILVATPEIEVDRLSCTSSGATMRGVEITLQSDPGRPLSGWVSYAWSRALDRIGTDVPRSWDQPHVVRAALQWRRGPWYMAGTFSWHTGWPYTPLVASAQTWTDPSTVKLEPGARNSLRYRAFQSMDLRIGWVHPLLRGELEASFELRNAFNSYNECCRDYEVESANGSSTLQLTPQAWLPVTPLLSVRWRLR